MLFEYVINTNLLCDFFLKGYMHLNVCNNIIYNCQDMEETQVLINRWMEEGVIHTHRMGYHSVMKQWNFAISSNMDGWRALLLLLSRFSRVWLCVTP